jgi:hypothetical protein
MSRKFLAYNEAGAHQYAKGLAYRTSNFSTIIAAALAVVCTGLSGLLARLPHSLSR